MARRLHAEEIINKTIPVHLIDSHPDNYNQHPEEQISQLAVSHEEFGQYRSVVVWARPDGRYVQVAGHGYLQAAMGEGQDLVRADILPENTSPETIKAIMIADNLHAQNSSSDDEMLAHLLQEQADAGYSLASMGTDDEALKEMLSALGDEYLGSGSESNDDDFEEEPDEEQTRVKLGDVWQLGRHRILCGDSTKIEDICSLIEDEKIILVHADPPYGMGKENDGVANDNLYREKLDTFQMQWWNACRSFMVENASVYIWGNAEDLWRLWYTGGLKNSERMTLRNEIVWDKEHGQGMNSDQHRMYPTASERCLFFILGKQGFSTNADNYWEGWEPVRSYLDQQREYMGWSDQIIRSWLGMSGHDSHLFSTSQWKFLLPEQYAILQEKAQRQAFKRDYDDLKRDFYESRSYFDNTHDVMTDVWQYSRVLGEERFGHPTPKPVGIIERIIKTSSPKDALVYEPFLGSGTTLMASHHVNRRCYGLEINPDYVDVCIRRWEAHTNQTAQLIERVEEVAHD